MRVMWILRTFEAVAWGAAVVVNGICGMRYGWQNLCRLVATSGHEGYKSHAAVCVIEAMLILLVHGRGSFIALETSHELYVLGYSYKKAFSRIVTSVNVPPIRIL